MLPSLYRLIESALELDHTLSLEDKETILACCRSPAKYRERQDSGKRLLRISQVIEMLSTSRASLWRLCKAGKLHPVLIGDSRRYRLSEIEALIEGNPSSGRQV